MSSINKRLRFSISYNLYPKMIMQDISSDHKFMEEIGIENTMSISIPNLEVSFTKSSLFDAVKKLRSASSSVALDEQGKEWGPSQ